jgi:hypothetical protein
MDHSISKEFVISLFGSRFLVDKRWGAHLAGRMGCRGYDLLPQLLAFCGNPDVQSNDPLVSEALYSVGRILRSCLNEDANDHRVQPHLDILCDMLDDLNNEVWCAIVYALAITGVNNSRATSKIESRLRQEVTQKMACRAYQFATSVDRTLLSREPWSNCDPGSNELRAQWDISAH